MTRITKTDLIAEIKDVNKTLEDTGSIYRYAYGSRNGYHAVDLCRLEESNLKVVRNLDCAEPPRVLIEKLLTDYKFYINN